MYSYMVRYLTQHFPVRVNCHKGPSSKRKQNWVMNNSSKMNHGCNSLTQKSFITFV